VYNQNDQVKQDEMVRECNTEKMNTYKGLAGKKEGDESNRRSWENNNEINLRKIGWGVMHWINLVQNMYLSRALVNMVMDLRVPKNVKKFLSG
jgi:hypothetical protein